MRTVLFTLLLTALALPATVTAAPPVAVAVDASRSLSERDLSAIREALAATVAELPAEAPVGVIAFNDEARWLTTPTTDRGAVGEALDSLAPEGNFTVLHDALFLAARELDEGGVILVVTDGRDENSATTVEDVAGRCVDHHVRVVAVSSGRWVDERALRRLALLTSGEYLGALAGTEPSAVAASVAEAQRAVAAEIEAARPPEPVQPPVGRGGAEQVAAEPPVTQPAPSLGWLPWLVALILAVILAAVLWRFLGRRGGAAGGDRSCELCGATLEAWETSCAQCAMAELGDVVNSSVAPRPVPADAPMGPTPVEEPKPSDESVLDPAVFDKKPLPFSLDQTLVLDEQPVLEIKQRGKPPRTYALPSAEIFAVGRAPEVNTLQLEDPTISGQHFKVVPKDGDYYVVDLGTTNGTQVNHERVKVKKLNPGDVITVGQVEFEFKMKVRRVS